MKPAHDRPCIRIAAVGDLHVGPTDPLPVLDDLEDRADLLLLAGDLTRRGLASEARRLASVLGPRNLPIVAVLGNHDHHSDSADQVTDELSSVGGARARRWLHVHRGGWSLGRRRRHEGVRRRHVGAMCDLVRGARDEAVRPDRRARGRPAQNRVVTAAYRPPCRAPALLAGARHAGGRTSGHPSVPGGLPSGGGRRRARRRPHRARSCPPRQGARPNGAGCAGPQRRPAGDPRLLPGVRAPVSVG